MSNFDDAFVRHAEDGRVGVAHLLPLLRDLSEPAVSTPTSVLACAVAHVSEGRPAIAIHRTPASDERTADRPISLMQRLVGAAKFREDVAKDGRITVDDHKSSPPISVHCMVWHTPVEPPTPQPAATALPALTARPTPCHGRSWTSCSSLRSPPPTSHGI